jgi:hypothetical protein
MLGVPDGVPLAGGVPLTTTYHLGKGTVLRLLRKAGVTLRQQPLTDDQINRAVQFYEQGCSLTQVGEHLGRDHTVIWNALKQAGIPRRDSHGRPRYSDGWSSALT